MIRAEIKKLIQEGIKNIKPVEGLSVETLNIKASEKSIEKFGDYTATIITNYPRFILHTEFCKDMVEAIQKNERFDQLFKKIEFIEPAFINFHLKEEYLQEQIKVILDEGDKFGSSKIGKGQKVQVEFISANPTGPLTLGNGRGGFYGDVLANVLKKTGFEVEREYYVNDAGEQVRKLGHSVLSDEQAVYKGRYIADIAAKVIHFKEGYQPSVEDVGTGSAKVVLQEMIKPTVGQKMKIKFDNWFSEASLHESGKIDDVLGLLKEKGLAYEKDGALWFKSTQFGGDDKDRVLIKAGGEKTYLASDIAYLKNKFERSFDKLIYIWGADHHGYVSRLKAGASALGYNPDDVNIIIMQLVRLMSGGKEVRMSKRAGIYVTLDELLDEIPLDVARFFFLMYSSGAHMNFDLDLAKERSQKNPVYYIQYAYARICSIFRKSNVELSEKVKLDLLSDKNELNLVRKLIKFPEIVEDIAKDYQVHHLPHYALDLVRAFHRFYETCKVIDEKKPDLTQARLALVKAVQIVLKNALGLMGITAPEKM